MAAIDGLHLNRSLKSTHCPCKPQETQSEPYFCKRGRTRVIPGKGNLNLSKVHSYVEPAEKNVSVSGIRPAGFIEKAVRGSYLSLDDAFRERHD